MFELDLDSTTLVVQAASPQTTAGQIMEGAKPTVPVVLTLRQLAELLPRPLPTEEETRP